MLSYPAVHCLDSSGLSEDTAQLHFLHLVTVAHIVQILLTSVPGENLTFPLTSSNMIRETALMILSVLGWIFMFVDSCVPSEEMRMEQESGGAEREEEERVCMLYNTLRTHLSR